jgi:hypothetical protein
MLLFRTFLIVDAIAAAMILFFFMWGLADGTVSSFNILLWMALLGGTAAVLGGGWALKQKRQMAAANVLLAVLAAPTLMFGLFLLVLIASEPDWR